MLETGQFFFGPPPRPPLFPVRPVEDKLGGRIETRDSSASSRSRYPGSISVKGDSSAPQSSLVSSVIVVERVRGNNKSSGEDL